MLTPDRWRQIEQLYDAARNCAPRDRAVLLECIDPDIRARVERMLEIESSSGLLDQSPASLLADPTRTVLASGAQLGPYKIEAQIGSGGMGTVYRAVDTRLGRVVAIKIAADRYSQRFQLEARAISALNHPNICTLYDIGPNYLVMELIEGSTLSAELKKGPFSPEVAARYGAQIAGALVETHSLGILHRDLKPSNIMLTRHGIKVLDFGLAKLTSQSGITETGRILGTPAYMSPEQIEGREPGPSSDLYSLGLVLYEMTTGKRPQPGVSFRGASSSGPTRRLNTLIAQLLDPAPERPPATAAGVRHRLEALSAVNERRRAPQLAFLCALVALVIATAWWIASRNVPGGRTLQVARIAALAAFQGEESDPAFSPDGHFLAFSWNGEKRDNFDIYVMPVGGETPVRLTEDPARDLSPAWSPDGRQIAFLHLNTVLKGSLVVIPSAGGVERVLRPVSLREDIYRAMRPLLTWTPDGRGIVYTATDEETGRAGLYLADPRSSATRELLGAREGELAVTSPAFTRDGKSMAYAEVYGPFQSRLFVRPVSAGWRFSGEPTRVSGPDDVIIGSPAWSAGGETLLYAQGSAIRQWKRGGRSEQIYVAAAGLKGMSVAWGPSQVRAATANSPIRELYSVALRPGGITPSGSPRPFGVSTATRGNPQFSPDGGRIAYITDRSGTSQIWVADANGRNPHQLTHLNSTVIGYPRWSADSRRIAFHSWMGSRPQVFTIGVDSNRPAAQLTNAAFGALSPSWSADGKYIYFGRIVDSPRMFRIPAQGGPIEDLFEASGGIVAPDGRRIVYFKENRSGIFSRSLDGDPASNPEVKLVDDYKAPGDDLNPFPDGIYYISWNGDGRRRAVRFYNYAQKKSVDVIELPGPVATPPDLAVSPDRRRLIFHQLSAAGTQLSMIDFE